MRPFWTVWLFVWLGNGADARATSSSKAATTASTCPFRTVNYITHSLPQQCLPSPRPHSLNVTTTSDHGNFTQFANPVADAFSTTPTSSEEHPQDGSSFSSSVVLGSPTAERPVSSATQASQSLTSSSSATLATPSTSTPESDDDFPLDKAKFLSFEEWKKQNLVKMGQSEHLSQGRDLESTEPRRRPVNVHNTLDALGDDAEIDLDFSGFVPVGPQAASSSPHEQSTEVDGPSAETRPFKATGRGREGTTSKERFNYASFDCAANVLKTNPQAKGALAVLGENKDSYMLNECSADNKFLILELCNDIQIDTLVLANYEFFSSTFRAFQVSVSDRYPIKMDKWKTIGVFEARNTREIQVFLVENPIIWARYVRIEFLTHYGNEFYCPLSLVRIHGVTMLEEYKHGTDTVPAEEEDYDDTVDVESLTKEQALAPDPIAEVLIREEKEALAPSDTTLTGSTIDETATGTETAFNISATTLEAPKHTRSCVERQMHPRNSTKLFPIASEATCATGESPMTGFDSAVPQTSDIAPSSISVKDSFIRTTVSGHTSTSDITSATPIQSEGSTAALSIDATAASSQTTSTASAMIQGPDCINTASRTRQSSSSTQPTQPAPSMQDSFFKSVQKRLQMLETNSSLSLQYIEEQSRALSEAFAKVEQRQVAKTTTFLDYLNTTVLQELKEFRQQYDQLWQSTVIELEVQREQFQRETLAINARLGVLANEVVFQKRLSIMQMLLIALCLGLVLFSRGSTNYLELPLVQSMLSRSQNNRWTSNTPGGMDTPSQQNSPQLSRPSSSHQLKTTPSLQGILKWRGPGPRGHHSRETSDDSRMMDSSNILQASSPTRPHEHDHEHPYSPPTPASATSTPNHHTYPTSTDEEDEAEADAEDKARKVSPPSSAETPRLDPVYDPSDIERPRTSPGVLAGAANNGGDDGEDDSITPVVSMANSSSRLEEGQIHARAHFWERSQRSGLADGGVT